MTVLTIQRSWRCWLAAIACGVVATVHTNQAVLLSGLSRMPGDLGDGRFNNLVLEHVWLAWHGVYPLWSPGQFYPTADTLAYSDNHLGTALIYAGFRALGAGMETAFQGWLVVIAFLNGVGFFALLRSLAVRPWICVACTGLGAASAPLLAQIGHPQLLPFFPFILTLMFLLRFLRVPNWTDLAGSVLCFSWQQFCYLYDGYFLVWFVALILIFFGLTGGIRLPPARGGPWWFFLASTGVGIGALIWLYLPYYRLSAHQGTRSLAELALYAPRWGSWWTADTYNVLSGRMDFLPPPELVSAGENRLFGGWVPWILLIGGSVYFATRRGTERRESGWRTIGALVFTWFAVLVIFTGAARSGRSVYLELASILSPIRAFRAFSRVGCCVPILQATFAGLVLERWANAGLVWRRFAIAAAIMLPFDTLCLGEYSSSKAEGQARAEAVLAQWRVQGVAQPLLFAPGFTNQNNAAVQLDAWAAALRCRGQTFNGYSGAQPDGAEFRSFLDQPSVEAGRRLLGRLKMSPASVAIVTDWGAQVDHQYGILVVGTAPSIALRSPLRELRLHPGEKINIPVAFVYRGEGALEPASHRLYLSYRVYNHLNRDITEPSSLRTAFGALKPEESVRTELHFQAPSAEGDYSVRLSIVQEGVAWWDDLGQKGDSIPLHVHS